MFIDSKFDIFATLLSVSMQVKLKYVLDFDTQQCQMPTATCTNVVVVSKKVYYRFSIKGYFAPNTLG